MPNVFVYDGPGAGPRSVLSAVESLKLALHPGVRVKPLSSKALLAGSWRGDCLALVMPGGADKPYCKVLNGPGNAVIREYVTTGGSYIGLCAGAYYACQRVEFEVGTELEVVGDRELAFFPGVARGCVVPGFDYRSEAGAAAVCLTIPADPAVHGAGAEPSECWDYSNGGPAFYPAGLEAAHHPDHATLASYASLPGTPAAALACAVGAGRAVMCGTHPELSPHWLGPGEREAVPSQDPIQGPGEGAKGAGDAYAAHVEELQRTLAAAAPQRWHLWLTLLGAAGLAKWLPDSSCVGER